VLKQVAISYGRRQPDIDLQVHGDREKQTNLIVLYTENCITNSVNDIDNNRLPKSCETSIYELGGYTPTISSGRFNHADFVHPDPISTNSFNHVFDEEISFEDKPTHGKQRRLIERVKTIYRKNNLEGLLPLGDLDSLALPGESYKLAFTSGLLLKVYQRQQEGNRTDNLLPDPGSILGGRGCRRRGIFA
jgi:hypothetical protein